jgi:hypothetical protein
MGRKEKERARKWGRGGEGCMLGEIFLKNRPCPLVQHRILLAAVQ